MLSFREYRDKRLRRKCIDEILAAVDEKGIELTSFPVDIDNEPWTYRRNAARIKLEELKRSRAEYSLDIVSIDILVHMETDRYGREIWDRPRKDQHGRILDRDLRPPVPSNHYFIGYIRNPNYDAEADRLEHRELHDASSDRTPLEQSWYIPQIRVVPQNYLPVYAVITAAWEVGVYDKTG